MSTADDVRRLLLALGSAYEAQAIASLEDASTEQQQVPFEPDSHHPALANHAGWHPLGNGHRCAYGSVRRIPLRRRWVA